MSRLEKIEKVKRKKYNYLKIHFKMKKSIETIINTKLIFEVDLFSVEIIKINFDQVQNYLRIFNHFENKTLDLLIEN